MREICTTCKKDCWLFETHFTPTEASATDATLAAATLTADIGRLGSRITAVGGSRVSHNCSLSWKRYKRVFLGHFLSSNYKVQCNYLTELLLVTAVWAQLSIRVDMVGTNRDEVLTLWRHMPMGQFCANIFLIQLTSTYFWASEVFKNQSF